ncbi:hypothetical protein DM02DRAFT_702737 [Periconia macrospinosa]|uniref:Uncharacterized protein n=1 Tax=Periconia macrospinosa TaxID=97972 RepID=A0A2V1D1F7_9PLEO|nr:hypothetical protein DM02DRAFT_702737 [Periconia macrospinosa]
MASRITRARQYHSSSPEDVTRGPGKLLSVSQAPFESLRCMFGLAGHGMSTFRYTLLAQLLVLAAAVRIVEPFHVHPLLSMVMRLVALGLVADRASTIAVQLRQIPPSRPLVHHFCTSMPFAAGLCTELILVLLMLRHGRGAMAQRLLSGAVYAKLLAAGGLCFVFRGRLGFGAADRYRARLTTSALVLGIASALAAVSPTDADTRPEQRFQVTLLHWFVYLGFILLYGDWYRRAMQEVTAGAAGCERSGTSGPACPAAFLATALVVLKLLGVWLAHGLIETCASANEPSLDFVVPPLASAVMDHAIDARLASHERVDLAWMGLVQSAFRTWFFARPAAAMMHRDVLLNAGRLETICTAAVAVWLCIPGVPRACIASAEETLANRKPDHLKGAGLLCAYAYLLRAWLF